MVRRLFWIAFALPSKLYRLRPLFTHTNGCGGAISVTERSCVAPISKVERHISDSFCVSLWSRTTNISSLFASQSNIHSYNTRSSSRGDYYVKHSRLDKQTKSFSRYGVKIWNSLPCEMRQMSKNNFKINVHDTLLRILSEENDYIDLPDLITKISWKLGFLYLQCTWL